MTKQTRQPQAIHFMSAPTASATARSAAAACIGRWLAWGLVSTGLMACEGESKVLRTDASLFEPEAHERPRSLRAVSVSVGTRHACALTDTGRLVCWGEGAEIGRTDGAAGRVASVSVGELATGVTYRSGDVQTNPARSFERSERPFPFKEVPQGSLVGEKRILQFELGHGLDQQSCVLRVDGDLVCSYIRRLTETYDDEVEAGSFLTPYGDFVPLRLRRWRWISPHAGMVGCGRGPNGQIRCWTAGITVSPGAGSESPWVADPFATYRGELHLQPEDTVHVCASPAQVCRSDTGGRVQCQATELRPVDRYWSVHTLASEATIEFEAGEVRAMACGALTGPAFYDPPFYGPPTQAQVCIVDGRGRTTCIGEDGRQQALFAEHEVVAIDSSGAATCAVTRFGKVMCYAHTPEAPYFSIEEVPRGLAP